MEKDLLAEIRHLKRAGEDFVGRVSRMEQARDQTLNTIQAGMMEPLRQAFYGSAVYFEDPDFPDTLGTLDQMSINTSVDHQEFINCYLKRRHVPKDQTSAGEAFSSGQSGVYASRMASHDCTNIVVDTDQTRLVFQFVMARGFGIPAEKIQNVFQLSSNYYVGSIRDILKRYGPRLSRPMGLQPPRDSHNGALLFADISHSARLFDEGEMFSFDFMDAWRDKVMNISNEFGGRYLRDEGDGNWIGFPSRNESVFLAARALEAAYRDFRCKQIPSTATQTHIRSVIASGYFITSIQGDVFESRPHIKYNGLPYFQARALSGVLPRNRDIVVLTTDSVKHYLTKYDLDLKRHHVPASTFSPDMWEWRDRNISFKPIPDAPYDPAP